MATLKSGGVSVDGANGVDMDNGVDGADGVNGDNCVNGANGVDEVEESLDETKNGGTDGDNIVAIGVKTFADREHENQVFDELEVPARIGGYGLSPKKDDSGSENESEETHPPPPPPKKKKRKGRLPRKV